tara:strand:+ start:432 stop:605 length:174 start_codon:yes stop_codon:yes gene_type:complete
MKYDYSINEILSAIDEIQNKKKERKSETLKHKSVQKGYSAVPKNTLRLIEEAEKTKN